MQPALRLSKHHGLGNDFLVLLDQPGDAGLARRVCDRRRGVGADGLLLGASGGPDGADLTMVLFNADGSRAEMSGNGIRCLAQAEAIRRGVSRLELTIATDSGNRRVVLGPGDAAATVSVTVDMGKALPGPEPDRQFGSSPPQESFVAKRRHMTVDIGNPHLVYLVDDVDQVDLEAEGRHPQEAYRAGINVEFIAPTPGERDALELRVWERGAGITAACGTGACAAVHAASEWGLVGERAQVHMPGGDVEVVLGDTVSLIGTATFVARIELEPSTS